MQVGWAFGRDPQLRSRSMFMPNETKTSAVELYRPYLPRWQAAAGFWLLTWYSFAVGGALAAAFVAANPAFLRANGEFTTPGALLAWFAVGATLVTNFLRPWRFHRAYQRAVYKLQAGLDRAVLDSRRGADLPKIVDECRALILEAGKELDAADGLPKGQGAKKPDNEADQ